MYSRNLLDPITPGEILKEDFLAPLEISINQLARNIGVPPIESAKSSTGSE